MCYDRRHVTGVERWINGGLESPCINPTFRYWSTESGARGQIPDSLLSLDACPFDSGKRLDKSRPAAGT
ncbi:hypothetical protein ACJ73_02331 [Blastomyces percursus]|uniref:Uncharacterized protein n=1 Tax=Blastomyces percursus TaxID=1658174 RepID=A0A1J9R1L7_9EURO|nr:hypothetical protein ACJ73_02331 [Blastomyces percursus]